MSQTPYHDLPDYCFWRRSHANGPEAVDPVVRPYFTITKRDRIASAGSCFAQHLSRYLAEAGLRYFVTETAHPLVAKLAHGYNYRTFSARYGNIYTAAQLRQLAERAFGDFVPVDDIWAGDDGDFYDPFRPAIQPGGFATRAEYMADRQQHFAAVRRLFTTADVFIVTLGLTEAWRSLDDGAVYPLCPGVAAGRFDPSRHEFVNYGVPDTVRDLSQMIRAARRRNPGLRFIFTVSPVPLIATAVDRSVIQSTVYSKSVLRVAAEMVTEKFDGVAYFPSYEIITAPGAGGRYFADDHRSVRPEGVRHVMRLFLRHYAGIEMADGSVPADPGGDADKSLDYEALQHDLDIICDEEVLAAVKDRG
jgi:hypothetical protein